MELGLCMASLLDRDWESALDAAAACGITAIEPCGGGNVPPKHYDPVSLDEEEDALAAFSRSAEKRGLRIAALGAYGNPLHPDPAVSGPARRDILASVRVAAKLGVDRVTAMVGCPAGAPGDRTPNWIVNSIYPKQWEEAYAWQWEVCVVPVWQELGRAAAELGVRVCIEPMAGDVVYNLATFRRLRDAVGPMIRANVDPSHLWWQGIDVPEMILELGDAIGFAHAKDVRFDQRLVRSEGLIPACAYDDWDRRSWAMRAIGYGHDASFWRDYVTALRRAGYDDVLAIELQEPYLTTGDALRMSVATLSGLVPAEAPPAANWFDSYSTDEVC